MNNDIERVLISEEELEAHVAEIGRKITEDFKDKDPIFVGVLKGCFIFMADLMRHVDIKCSMDFMAVSSYSGTSSTGAVKINKDLSQDIEDRHVIIVEDIVDSGRTICYLEDLFRQRECASVRCVSLLDKPDRRVVDAKVDYTGFVIPDQFVVGYGMDYDERYRNLPFIGVVELIDD